MRYPDTFHQRDPQWSSIKIANSSLSMGSYGCAVTCLAMMLSTFVGHDETPLTAMEKLAEVGAFTSGGWIIWSRIQLAFPEVDFLARDYVVSDYKTQLITSDVAFTRAKKMLRIGQFPMLAVRLGANQKQPNHWVLAVDDIDDDLIIHDPWTGDRVSFSSRYGDPYNQIFGLARIFGPRSTTDVPDETLATIAFKAHEMTEGRGIDTYKHEIFKNLTR